MTRTATYEIHRAQDGQFYFVHMAANGEPLATSETYTTRRDAHRGAMTAAGPEPVRFVDRTYDEGQ